MKWSELLKRVRDGSLDGLDGKPHAMSESTFNDILRSLRKQRQDLEDFTVEAGSEEETANTIIRETLAMAKRDQAWAKQAQTASESAKQKRERLAVARDAAKLAGDCRYWLKRTEPAKPRSSANVDRAQAASTQAPKTSRIGALASARGRDEQQTVLRQSASLPNPDRRHVSQNTATENERPRRR